MIRWLGGSTIALTAVVFDAPSTDRAYRPRTSSACPGRSRARIAALSALRSMPITAAASRPWPTTSPTATAKRPPGRSTKSYQSPHTFSDPVAGR
ncbi:hypothetical protein L0U85_07405 [Glycomyces sp. L485]|nr:hypothetical protein [Glycomyces sp. L485]MCH7230677.1 hypothetical protein [Glycomyces sp. L485]